MKAEDFPLRAFCFPQSSISCLNLYTLCSFNIFLNIIFSLYWQFFGFKNSFVQRLLREMVANVSVTIEQNLSSSRFCKEGTKADHISSRPDAHKQHDLLPLDRSQITGKRSRKRQTNTKSSSNANLKRSRSHELANVVEASNVIEEKQRIHSAGSLLPSFKGKSGHCEQPLDLPPSANLIPAQEETSHISENDLPLDSANISNNHRSIVPSEEAVLVVGSRICSTTSLAGNLLTEEKPVSTSFLFNTPLQSQLSYS